jgi:hypothetical protein
MVVLKHTGSRLFDEVYFILKNPPPAGSGRVDMVTEANRILAASTATGKPAGEKPRRERETLVRAVLFLAGLLLGAGGAALLLSWR